MREKRIHNILFLLKHHYILHSHFQNYSIHKTNNTDLIQNN